MTKQEILGLSDYSLDKHVKIAGTDHDRRRIINNDTIMKMNVMAKMGNSARDIAQYYGFSTDLVKYHIDPDYKQYKNSQRKKYRSSNRYATIDERIAYKRALIQLDEQLIVTL